MKGRSLARPLLLVAGLVAGLLVANALRFSNQIEIDYDGRTVRARSHRNTLEMAADLGVVRRIDAQVQESKSSKGGLELLSVYGPGDGLLFRDAPPVLFVLGRDWLGTLRRAGLRRNPPTYGDWSMDRLLGERFVVDDQPVSGPWRVTARFAGRGTKRLFVVGERGEVAVHVNDGFIDNDFALCLDGDCPRVVLSEESPGVNASRVVGVLIEIVLLAAAVALLLVFGVAPWRRASTDGAGPGHLAINPRLVLCVVCAAHVGLTSWFGLSVLGGIPHIPDSAMYYRQAILLSRGATHVAQAPAEPAAAFASNGAVVRGRAIYYDHANRFWPAVLAAGLVAGLPALVNPALSGFSVLLVYLIGARLYDRRTALVGAALYAMCPLVIILGGGYMMHTATTTCLLAAIWAGMRAFERPNARDGLMAGAAAAFAFGLRQLTAVAVLAPFVACVLLSRPSVLIRDRRLAWVLPGAGVVLAVWLWDNYAITGDPFLLPLTALHGHSLRLSQLPLGLNHVDALLGYLPAIFLFLPIPMFSMALVGLPFFLARRPADVLLAAAFVSLVAGHSLAPVHGLHGYGPRFLLEGVFALCLLSARGATLVWERAPRRIGKPLAAIGAAAFVGWQVVGFALVLPQYRHYNGIDSDLHARLADLDLTRSTILVGDRDWTGMEVAATLFDPDFEAAVFVQELADDSHLDVLRALPDRQVYRVEGRRIELWDPGLGGRGSPSR